MMMENNGKVSGKMMRDYMVWVQLFILMENNGQASGKMVKNLMVKV